MNAYLRDVNSEGGNADEHNFKEPDCFKTEPNILKSINSSHLTILSDDIFLACFP